MFSMGGYGAFVWSSYGLVFAAMGWLIVASVREQRRRLRDLRAKMLQDQ